MEWTDNNIVSIVGSVAAALLGGIPGSIALFQNRNRDKTKLDITLIKVDDFDDKVKQVHSYQAGNGIDKMPTGSQAEPIYLVNITNTGMQPAFIQDCFILPHSTLEPIRPKSIRTISNSIHETYDFNEKQMLEIPSKKTVPLPLYLYHGKPVFSPKKVIVIDGENKKWKGKLDY
ncbi:hypothetical protein [Shewanella sp. 10N.286.54.B9]|uniref:hypothetical protein n=1 Tax=Shewanella sp. 10N.286.54.B9 TaxID=3229719 RepID=UPI00354FA43B